MTKRNGPLAHIRTPILVIGREATGVIRGWFDRIGYGPETVTYVDTIGDGRAMIRRHRPAVLVIGREACHGDCKTTSAVVTEARFVNEYVRMISLCETPCLSADIRLPWPVERSKFLDAIKNEAWNYAVAQGGYRGHIEKRRPVGSQLPVPVDDEEGEG